ncbi:hypothetical protein LEP1GSC036_0391 [Leptospira weilii str. 2006001853]|uniref:Uncharacterized protein n=1 Tax=Leptospira weilii str. 2006001853 TaxID=1001589 RepID=A0A828Z6X9_9LEPT|nr:hypothetical protein LEP1GSC036_0391 [Leptospira weilii str. 2006001853]EMN46107.1 hypothetical protein LEP1GSC086_0758 [Leptospira weilii str. LNT 1234]
MKPPGNVDDRNSKVIFPLVKNIHDKNLPHQFFLMEKTDDDRTLQLDLSDKVK